MPNWMLSEVASFSSKSVRCEHREMVPHKLHVHWLIVLPDILERERERERERMYVCVRERGRDRDRERERENVCLCEREGERQRERERETKPGIFCWFPARS